MLSSLLPIPKHSYDIHNEKDDDNEYIDNKNKINRNIPQYPLRVDSKFLPRELDDYNDGGAYPEIHVVQYPLNMGKPGHKSTAIVTVNVDDKGEVCYDAIVKQGQNQNKLVKTSINDLKESEGSKDSLALPDETEEQKTAERTRQALESIISGKIKSTKVATINSNSNAADEPTYIRYTPNPDAPGYNEAAKQRVIRMVEAQVDPMEPPKHKHVKVPKGSGSPPVPVLHSPPRKLTAEDQQAWKIPPCISNWKNSRGYTIPLDKRLAADGRGLQEVTINNKFAMLSESLYVAERKASEDLRVRNQIRKKLAMKEKEDKEQELRNLAARARMERSGVMIDKEDDGIYSKGKQESLDSPERDFDENDEYENPHGETEAEKVARQQREKLRLERRKERERELRMENMKGSRKNKVDRDGERDISEKIALGQFKGSGKVSGEALYDSRLFNQSSGMDSGFGADDEYNTYSKPLFDRGEAASIYRPKRDDADVYGDVDTQMAKLSDTSKFKPDKGFKGTDGGRSGGARDAPVQFEKADDPFGLDDLLQTKKARHE